MLITDGTETERLDKVAYQADDCVTAHLTCYGCPSMSSTEETFVDPLELA
jgi:hypothetical protein